MFKVDNITYSLSQKIGKQLNYDNSEIEVINYGLFALVQTLISILSIAFFGLLFNVFVESMIISFTISILRKYSGGAHASTPGRCAILGTVVSVGMSILLVNINIPFEITILLGIIIFIVSFCLIYKLAPVDSEAKPIRNLSKIKRLRRSSILILTLYFIVVLFNIIGYTKNNEIRFLTYTLCIYIGLLWQVFSLTQSGHKLLARIDALF